MSKRNGKVAKLSIPRCAYFAGVIGLRPPAGAARYRRALPGGHAGDRGQLDTAPLQHVLSQVVMRAVERAADPAQLAAQRTGAGLQAWQVKKVLGALPAGQQGDFNLAASPFLDCSPTRPYECNPP
jgi:hypothetical protein